jgi:hypothetical protein
MKKVIFAVVAFMFSLSAFAADTIKGTNQNALNEVVPIEIITQVKYDSGKVYFYVEHDNSVYYIVDASATQYNKVLSKWGVNKVTYAATGWTWPLSKVKIKCDSDGGTGITTPSRTAFEKLSDGCAVWQVANGL